MIAYLDTSALVKIFINETNSEIVRKVYLESEYIAISNIGYVEFHSAIGRLFRENLIDSEKLLNLKNSFNIHWNNYQIIDFNKLIQLRASELLYQTELRAFDSIHLASAEFLKKNIKEKLKFICFDKRLIKAAKPIGLELL
jgi:predicted nucleic acid-binding protein